MATKAGGVSQSPAASKRWHAVSVKPCPGACVAAASNRQRRWLSREAPQLPLPGCTRPDTCRCTYQHHDDRRAGGRRAEETDVFRAQTRPVVERRSRRDRRSEPDE
ncbi:MAG: hypothetical protein WBO00_07535 [Steroidobacteraceae bacterium]